jgi:hypothetical protein
MNSPYLEDILLSSRRLFTLLNRNPLDETTGSFDRSFWHFKTTDFSSSTRQMSIGILSKLWKLNGSEYFQSKLILRWIEYGISYLDKIQHRDGSFDEWYVNERGWAGPTGYIMNACLDCYENTSDNLDPIIRDKLKNIIVKGINFLKISTEGHMIANHIAIVILPLVQAKHLLQVKGLDSTIDNLLQLFESSWNHAEGWSLEYDGADPGYQSGSLSFLAKSLKYEENNKIKEICRKSLEFISYFSYPSGSVGGNVGSRHTVTYFCAGIEYFRDLPLGSRMSRFIEEGILNQTHVLSSDLDDHYMIYRLYELLDAHEFYNKKKKHIDEEKLPYEQKNFIQTFSKANIFIKKDINTYLVVALNKGGAYRLESTIDKNVISIDSGVMIRNDKKVLSSLNTRKADITIDKNIIKINGYLSDVTTKNFKPITFIIFRLFMLVFGSNYRIANIIKKLIKSVLIFNNESKKYKFERIIQIQDDKLLVKTSLNNENPIEKVIVGGEFWTRYVPQSRHFLKEQLDHSLEYCNENMCDKNFQTQHVVKW